MTFPRLSDSEIEQRLEPPKRRARMVLDTDTYNEIDDQFALVYALLSPEAMGVEAVYAAPFTNDRSNGPADGMEKSYDEIMRLLERLGMSQEGLALRGSTAYLGGAPERSPAALDLVERAMATPDDEPLYVVAIGAVTNVASAMLLEPRIVRKTVVVWLGGNPQSAPHTVEFNLMQDVCAARVIFDSGVPFVHVPCLGVASHMLTTKAELADTIAGRNAVGDFLYERFCEYSADHFAWGKEIWDIAAVAWLVSADWLPSRIVPSPHLIGEWRLGIGGSLRFEAGQGRHPIRDLWFAHRNPIFRDLFTKLRGFGRG